MDTFRTVTFVIKFKQENVPAFLWDSLIGKPTPQLPDAKVISIAEGNAVDDLEELEMSLAERFE